MNLLVFTEYFPASEHAEVTGGVEARAFGLLSEIAKRHTVTIVCSYQGRPQRRVDRIRGVTVLRVGPKSPYASTGNIIRRMGYVGAAFLTGLFVPKIQIVEGFSYLTYPVAAVVGTLRRKPIVATYHESWTFREWIQLKGWLTGIAGSVWTRLALLLPVTKYLAVSNATKQRLVEQGVKGRKIGVVYNGIDVAWARGIVAKRRASPGIVTTARLIKTKRIDVLIRAVAELKKMLPNVELTVLGDGPERPALEKLIAKLNLRKNVTIKNVQRFEEQLRIMKRHHVFCLPSEVEGFGMAVIAGMAAGLPVVCTDIPVLREITDNGKGGLLFKKGDRRDLAEKLKLLLTDQKRYAAKREEALRLVKRFDWKLLARQAERVYHEVLR